jgi:4-amino-4-deoxy-L-arabinose transferase-like glycosyltransferase
MLTQNPNFPMYSAPSVASVPAVRSRDGDATGAGRALCWILVSGAVLRLALWAWFQDLPLNVWDEQDYNQLAIRLVTHGDYASATGELVSLRPPLYPAFVASIYAVCGLENYQAVRFVQALLSLVTLYLAYRLGVLVSSRRVALVLAAGCCFYPSLLGFNNLLLTETLFTLLLLAFCLTFVTALQRQSLGWLAWAGVVLGLAALTRSVVWLLPPLLALFLLWAWQTRVRSRLAAGAVLVLTFAATIAPWAIRNTLLHKTFVTIDVMSGRNFRMGNYQHTPLFRSWDAISLAGDKSWWHEVQEVYPASERQTQGQVDKLAFRQGVKFVLANPGVTFQRSIVRFFDFWGLERELVAGAAHGFFGAISKSALALLAVLIFASYAAALLLAIYGVFLAPPRDRRLHVFFLLVILFVCALHTIVFGHSRYHLPLMPLVLLYASAAFVRLRDVWHARQRWSFRLATACCAVFVVAWLWLLVAVDLELCLNVMRSVG